MGWCIPLDTYDIVYQSKVFDETYSHDIEWIPQADTVIKGGTGYVRIRKKDNETWLELYSNNQWLRKNEYHGSEIYNEYLPYAIEHTYPDYSLYPQLTHNSCFGHLTRGCPNACGFCLVSGKEGRWSRKVADLNEFWKGQKNIELLDPNLLASKDHLDLLQQLVDSKATVNFNQGLDIRLTNEANISLINKVKVKDIHFAWDNPKDDLRVYFERYKALAKHKPHGACGTVYVLTNYASTMEENLYRIYTLRDIGYDPYVMIYDKPHAPKEIRLLQRWCNNRIIFKKCEKFEDYDPKKG